MTLRELTEAWMQGRLISWHDADGKLCGGRPIALEMGRGDVGAIIHTFGADGDVSLRFRKVYTSRFDKVRQEFETDLEPVR
jgi:hypothetical protein